MKSKRINLLARFLALFFACWIPSGPVCFGAYYYAAASVGGGGGGGDITFITGQTVGTDSSPVDERGMKITVGASPITVTELALWGNAGQYAATITLHVRAADGTSLGSVAVNTPSGTGVAGAYNWGTLSSPVVLSAGTSYFIMTAGLAFNTIGSAAAVTSTAAATVDGSAYTQPPLDEGAGANRSYGPLNFKYH